MSVRGIAGAVHLPGALKRAAVLALVLALAVPAAAFARKLVGTSPERLQSDGSRFAVYKSSESKLTVIDDARRRRFRMTVGASCSIEDVARPGFLLLTCSRTDGKHHVLDLRERSATRLREMQPDPVEWYDPDYEGFGEVGGQWLKGSSAMGPLIPFYLNWRTGQRRGAPDNDSTYTPLDLGDPELKQLGPPQPHGFAFDVAPPYSIAQRDRDKSEAGSLAGDLVLYRGGTAKKLGTRVAVVSRCRPACLSISLGGGFVTWGQDRVAHAYGISGRRRLSWKLDRDVGLGVQHTRTTLYWSRSRGFGKPVTIYAFSLR